MHRVLVPWVLVAAAAAQRPAESFGHSRHGAEFDQGPRQAACRLAGMSDVVHLPVAGLDASAQAMFDQGVTQLHGFWYFEAERSFRQVAKDHPACAMAYWGMALANFEHPERAAGCIANAVVHGAAAPRREQLYVDAWAAFHGVDDAARAELRSGDDARVAAAKAALAAANKDRSKADKEKAWRRLLRDLGTLVHEFPDDVEAKALLAVNIWHAYDWGQGIPIPSHVAVDALLDQVFARVPRHPAHHYRIHLWDAEAAERALRSAAAIGDSAPGIAHQWHMAGHIYAKLHRHAEAAWQQEASGRVDHAHMARDRVMPFLIHNYGHNQEWLARSLSYVGRPIEALAVAKSLASVPRHPRWNTLDDREHIASVARDRLVSVCEDHGLWAEAVALDHEGWLDPGASVAAEVQRLGLLGRAQFRLGRANAGARIVADAAALLQRARAERAAAVDRAEDEALARKSGRDQVREAMASASRRPTDAVHAVLELQRELLAEQRLAAGDGPGAIAALEGVDGLPATLRAEVHLVAGEVVRAIELLEQEAKDRPRRVPTLARLLQALAAATATAGASDAQRARHTEVEAELSAIAWAAAAIPDAGFAADFGVRPPLATLGPLEWQAYRHPGLELPDSTGARRGLRPGAHRPTLVVFYLGFGCLHCVQQLQALRPLAGAFADAGVELLAVGTDDVASAASALAALPPAERFPFPLLADPQHGAFRAFGCYDDFESMPLHGTFLLDAAGAVRWQDVGAEPFTQFDWLLAESRRLLALPAQAGAK